MTRIKPNHPSARPERDERPNNRRYLQTIRTKLRRRLTPAEASLWKALKGSQLEGRKFRRQHSVGDYVLDFYCPEERLAIELDGEVHRSDNAKEYDAIRREFLETHGIKVLRFENFLVFEEREFVLNTVQHFFGWWKTDSD
jgi:very-short-patch-repair endonuclease